MCTTETYDVVGMTCDHCVRSVTAEVSALESVCEVHVDLAAGQVHVTAHEPLATELLREAIEEAGYQLA
jgi:copper ion binding protein